jgi:hypothetical protein
LPLTCDHHGKSVVTQSSPKLLERDCPECLRKFLLLRRRI